MAYRTLAKRRLEVETIVTYAGRRTRSAEEVLVNFAESALGSLRNLAVPTGAWTYLTDLGSGGWLERIHT
jgi:hypothetical protein